MQHTAPSLQGAGSSTAVCRFSRVLRRACAVSHHTHTLHGVSYPTRIEPRSPAAEGWILNHWICQESSRWHLEGPFSSFALTYSGGCKVAETTVSPAAPTNRRKTSHLCSLLLISQETSLSILRKPASPSHYRIRVMPVPHQSLARDLTIANSAVTS